MKNIYRILSLVVVVFLLAAVLSGCGSKNSEETEQVAESETVDEQADAASEEAAEEAVVVEEAAYISAVKSVTLIKDSDDSAAAVAIEYESEINADSLSSGDFMVTSQDQGIEYAITAIYTNDQPAMADESAAGCYVIIELSENAADAMEDAEEAVEGPGGDDVVYAEDDGTEGPTATDDESETVVYPDGPVATDDEEDTFVAPEGWDPDADSEVIIGVSPAEMGSGEMPEDDGEDLGIVVVQIDTVTTVDGTDIGASPSQYSVDTVVVAE